MVAWLLMSNNFVLDFHELDNFLKHLEHIYLVFQHIIFISLDSSIFPLRIEHSFLLSFFIPKLWSLMFNRYLV